MKMCDYFETLRGKWVMISVVSGQGAYYQGVLQEVGEDDLVIKDETTAENPYMIPTRSITSCKEMRLKDNGKPRLFG